MNACFWFVFVRLFAFWFVLVFVVVLFHFLLNLTTLLDFNGRIKSTYFAKFRM